MLSPPPCLPGLLGTVAAAAAAATPHTLAPPVVSSSGTAACSPCPRACSELMASTAASAAASAARLHPSKLDSKHQSPVKTRRPPSAVTMPPPAGGSTWLVRQFKSFVFTGRGIFIPASSSSTPTIAAFAGPLPPPRLLASRRQSSVLDWATRTDPSSCDEICDGTEVGRGGVGIRMRTTSAHMETQHARVHRSGVLTCVILTPPLQLDNPNGGFQQRLSEPFSKSDKQTNTPKAASNQCLQSMGGLQWLAYHIDNQLPRVAILLPASHTPRPRYFICKRSILEPQRQRVATNVRGGSKLPKHVGRQHNVAIAVQMGGCPLLNSCITS